MNRPDWDTYFLDLVEVIKTRGTCARRKVGCILVNDRNQIIGTGYNGPARNWPHCIDKPCGGAGFKSGEGLEKCEAIHAEQNALLQCPDVYDIKKCYVTCFPCRHCIKLLLNTSCEEIIYLEPYSHMEEASELWENSNRAFKQGKCS